MEIAGILATNGAMHIVDNNSDVMFYKTPSYHEGEEVGEVHRVHCSSGYEDHGPNYCTFISAVEEIANAKCKLYFTFHSLWHYGGRPDEWYEFSVK
jgi:hypothetical protein